MKFLTSIDLSQNEIQNAIMQPLAAPPANPKIGQIYFNSIDLTLYLWTGEKWIPVPTKTSQLENDSGFITSGDIPEGAAASTTTPKMNGTAAVGTEMAFARGDHVHPKDTSKLNTDGDGSNVTVAFEASAKREAPTSGEKLSVLLGKVLKFFSDLKTVAFSGSYKDLSDKPTIPSAAADVGAIPATEKGAAGGVAELDSGGKVPANQLPSYVDDVVDAYIRTGATALGADWLSKTSGGAALTPESDKIYVILSEGEYQNKTYRWSGTTYAVIGNDLAIGETASTAYRGDRGKTQILPLKNGIDFLGFHTYLTQTGKVVRKVRAKSIDNMKRKIRKFRGLVDSGKMTLDSVVQSYASWTGHISHGNTYHLRQNMDAYFFSYFPELKPSPKGDTTHGPKTEQPRKQVEGQVRQPVRHPDRLDRGR